MNETRPERRLPPGAVVVGYDESAEHALDWAADHAVQAARPLVVLHATGSLGTVGTTWLNLSDPATEPTLAEMERHGQAVVARAIARAELRHPTLSATPLVTMEDPAAELVHLSRTAHVVVVGSRGHGVTRSVPTGQIGTWVARRTVSPVIVVPDFDATVVRQGVCVGVPSAAGAAPVLDFAYEYAAAHDLPVCLVQATKDARRDADNDRRRWLAEAIGGYAERYPDVRAHTILVPGRPSRTLLRMADRMDLLVVGQHASTGLHASPLGHVRSSIVDRSPCPTAVVPVHVTQPA